MSEEEKKEQEETKSEASQEAVKAQETSEAKTETPEAPQEKAEEVKAESEAQESAEAKAEEAPAEEKAAEPEPEPEPEFNPEDHTIRGIVGRKLGMTQIYDREGNVIPITVVEAGPCTVLEIKEAPLKIRLGFENIKETNLSKPKVGYFKKLGVKPSRISREFTSKENPPYKVGQTVKADLFKPGDYVDVTGTSIGKGFAGGMKRNNWSGGPGGHGSMHHRRVGSIGASAYPSKVVRGFPMPGQMGNKQVTMQGLRVMDIDLENNLLMLKGAVPGGKNGLISINRSRSKKWRDLNEVRAVVKHKVNPMKQSKAKAGKKKG